MGKDLTKNLVGQPIFKLIVKMLPREQFDLLVKQCGSDCYYKTLFSWDQLIIRLFGIFSQCDSMGEVCDGMRNRDEALFRLYYFALTDYFRPFLSVSRKEKVSFEEFYAFDSTTITLFNFFVFLCIKQ